MLPTPSTPANEVTSDAVLFTKALNLSPVVTSSVSNASAIVKKNPVNNSSSVPNLHGLNFIQITLSFFSRDFSIKLSTDVLPSPHIP